MKNCYKFFENIDCKFYPCHKGVEKGEFNCLFCFCPFYFASSCPGNPEYIGKIKDCTSCIFPHIPENYDTIIRLIGEYNKK